MPSLSFLQARKLGEQAQNLIAKTLRGQGFTVILIERGYHPEYDLIVERDGIRFIAEAKYDRLCAQTGNVCVDLASLRKSQALMLFYAIDNPDTKLFISSLADVLRFAQSYPIKKNVGEFKEVAALIPFSTFISLPFVKPL